MLALLLALPADTTLDFTGLPQLAAPTSYQIRGHSATMKVEGDTVVIESTTEYRNHGDATTATILVPRRRLGDDNSGQPTFSVEATWDKKPIKLTPIATRGTSEKLANGATSYASDLSVTLPFDKQATHALRLRATLALGRAGKGPQRRVSGYLLEGGVPVDILNIAFQYGKPTVFGLPDAAPDLGWQIGEKGAFTRKANFTPNGEIASIAFWKGGFDK